jgi:transposase InsO family protein
MSLAYRKNPEGLQRTHYQVHPLIQYFVLIVRMYLGWGAGRIEAEFRARDISNISHQTIHKIISKNALRPPVKLKRKINRYQRAYPDSLWHIDIKGPFWIKGVGKTYIIGLVDDCSRYIIGVRIYPSRKMENAISFLNANITLWAKPLDLMSDNDTAFCHWAQGVINQFQRLLEDHNINHLRTRVNSPETKDYTSHCTSFIRFDSSLINSLPLPCCFSLYSLVMSSFPSHS